MSKVEEVSAEPRRWSYFNVLEMLVAAMPPGKYTADIGQWTRVIRNLEEQYEDKYPDLFDDIYFVEREPLNPYSAGVEEFFQRIALVVYNPSYDVMEITPEKQERIRSRVKKRLKEEYVTAIEEMSAAVAGQLKPPSGGTT